MKQLAETAYGESFDKNKEKISYCLFKLLLDLEDVGNMFFRNVGELPDYTVSVRNVRFIQRKNQAEQ
jgi:hypothetical protein